MEKKEYDKFVAAVAEFADGNYTVTMTKNPHILTVSMPMYSHQAYKMGAAKDMYIACDAVQMYLKHGDRSDEAATTALLKQVEDAIHKSMGIEEGDFGA